MDLNATLFVQIIVFIAFIVFTMRYVWPPVVKALEDRRKKIADGLADAEKGERLLELSEIKAKEQLEEAKAEANRIVELANQRAHHIVEESKAKAREEGKRLLALSQAELEQDIHAAREGLMKEIKDLAIISAEKILQKEIDKASNDQLIDKLLNEVQS